MNAILVFLLLVPKLTSTIPLTITEIDCRNRTHLCRTSVQFYPCVRVGENRTIVISLEVQNCPDGFVCNAEMDTACHNIDNYPRNEASNEEAYSIKRYLPSFRNYQESTGQSDKESGELSLNFNSENSELRINNIQNTIKDEKVPTIIEENTTNKDGIIKQTIATLNEREFTSKYYTFTHDTTVTDEIVYSTNLHDTSTIFNEELSTQTDFNVQKNSFNSNYNGLSTKNMDVVTTNLEEHTFKIMDISHYLSTEDSLGNRIESTTSNKDYVIQNNLAVNNDIFEEKDFDSEVNIQTIHHLNIVSTTTFDVADNNQRDYHNIVSKNVENNDTGNRIEEHEIRPPNSLTTNVNLLQQYTETSASNDPSATIQTDKIDEISTILSTHSFEEAQTKIFENYPTINDISTYDKTVTSNPEATSHYLSSFHENEYYIGDNKPNSISHVENLSFTTADDATTLSTNEDSSSGYQSRNTNFDIYGTIKSIQESESIKIKITDDYQELSTQRQDYFPEKDQNTESTGSNNKQKEISTNPSFLFQSSDQSDEIPQSIGTTITESTESSIDTTIDVQSLFSSKIDSFSTNEESTLTTLEVFRLLPININEENIESKASNNKQKENCTILNFIFQSQTAETTESIKTTINESDESSIDTTIDVQSPSFSQTDTFSYTPTGEESTTTILNHYQLLSTLNQEEDVESTNPNNIQTEVPTFDSFISQSSDGNVPEGTESSIGTIMSTHSPSLSSADVFSSTSANEDSTLTILSDSQPLSTLNQDDFKMNEEDIKSTSPNIQKEFSTFEAFASESSDGNVDERAAFIETEITESEESSFGTTTDAQSSFSYGIDSFSSTNTEEASASTNLNDYKLLSTLNQDYSTINEDDIGSTSSNSMTEEISTFENFVSVSTNGNVDEKTAFFEIKIPEETGGSIGTTTDAQSSFLLDTNGFSSTNTDEESILTTLSDIKLLSTLNQDYSLTDEIDIESTSSNSMREEASTFKNFVFDSSNGNVDERAAFIEIKIPEWTTTSIDTTTDVQSTSSDDTDSFSSDGESTITILNDSQLLSTINQDYSQISEENIESTTNNIPMEVSTFVTFESSDGNSDKSIPFTETKITESTENNIGITTGAQTQFPKLSDNFSPANADEDPTILNNFQPLTILNDYSLINEYDIESTDLNSIQQEVSTFKNFMSENSDGNFDQITAHTATKIPEWTENSIGTTMDAQSTFSFGTDSFSSTSADEESTSTVISDSQLLSTSNQNYSFMNGEDIESTRSNSIQNEVSTFESFVSESSNENFDARAAFIETTITESFGDNIDTTASTTFLNQASHTNADEKSTILNNSEMLPNQNQGVYTDLNDNLQYSLNDFDSSTERTVRNNASNVDVIIMKNEERTTESSPFVSSQRTLQTNEDIDQTFDTSSATTSVVVRADEQKHILTVNVGKTMITDYIIRDEKRELGITEVLATERYENDIKLDSEGITLDTIKLDEKVLTKVIRDEIEVTIKPSLLSDNKSTNVTNIEISTLSTVSLDRKPQLSNANLDILSTHAKNSESTTIKLESLERNKEQPLLGSTQANIEVDFGVKDMSVISNNNGKLEYADSPKIANSSKVIENSIKTESSKKSEDPKREAPSITQLPLNVDTSKKLKPKRQATSSMLSTTPSSILSKYKCTGSGKFPEPKDCSVYHYCVDILIEYVHFLKRCPPGTLYDRTTQDCTDKPVRCSQDSVPTCTASGVFPHPTDCSLYYKCFWWSARRKFTLWQFKCPARMKYDPQRAVCVNGDPNCGTSSEFPFYCSENGRFPVEYSCDSYYECKLKKTEFQRKVKFCSPGKLFDREMRTCRKSALVFCPYKNDNLGVDSSVEFSKENY